MGLRDVFARQSVRFIQDPRVARFMRDERVMRTLMGAMRLRSQTQDRIDDGIEQLARRLNLATKREIRELKRTLRRVEQELERERRAGGSGERKT